MQCEASQSQSQAVTITQELGLGYSTQGDRRIFDDEGVKVGYVSI
jgi:hypothetical protein